MSAQVMNQRRIVVLCFVGFYLPGYKAGGPLRTIANMVSHLNENIEFWIVTRDRDLGATVAYPEVKVNEWQDVQGARVYYLPPERCTIKVVGKLISQTAHDVLYLNSFFDFEFSIKPLLARRLGLISRCPVVLAPRGEFSIGALELKSFKKKLFIRVSNYLRLYHGVIWQASSKLEKRDIIRALDVGGRSIFTAKDLPAKVSVRVTKATNITATATCRLIFISRISPKKNLDFALRALARVKSSLIFDIYGPIEDEDYWGVCLSLVKKLPKNVSVNYRGFVAPHQVAEVFSGYDLFFFPTRGENYGHVIAESLSVGTPVLLSDQTPWQDLARDELGWDLPLDLDMFVEKIEKVAGMDIGSRVDWRERVFSRAISRINNKKDVSDNFNLFDFAVNSFERPSGDVLS